MIIGIPSSISVLWITVLSWVSSSGGFILFGLYYGFLATLPIGPSQLIAMRAFLLDGNFGGLAAVCGSIIGQLIILLSIYYSPFYVVLMQPHIFTLLMVPYTFFYWYRIKDLVDYQSLRSITSFRDIRIFGLFFDSVIFQLINPILLPSPILARLINLLLFRYSNNSLFLTSAIFGWLYGQYLFIHSGKSLLFRVESDSPVLYLLMKRIIHRTFGILTLSLSLLHLSRTPVPFMTKKLIDNLQFNLPKRENLQLPSRSWITNLFFDHRRWRRPFRYIPNSGFSNKSPVKGRVSQYLFNACLSDGKPRLSLSYLPSLAIFEKNFAEYLNPPEFRPSSESFMEWVSDKRGSGKRIYKEFQYRIDFLENGFSLRQVGQKKTELTNHGGVIFLKFYNPLLMRQRHETTITSKSPWFLSKKPKKEKFQRLMRKKTEIKRSNKPKNWISNQWQGLKYKDSVLPWEPLNRDARRTLSLLINKSTGLKLDLNQKQKKYSDRDVVRNSVDGTNSSSIRKRMNRKSSLNWELILNLSFRQRILYFNHLRVDEKVTLQNFWKNFFPVSISRFWNFYSSLIELLALKNETRFQFVEMNKQMPRWAADLRNDKFDVIALGVTDIRQRRVKNLGYLTRGEDRRRKIVRRFSQQSDFRRELIKGSTRARRRKTPLWKILQLQIKSPFFIRMTGKLTIIQTFSDRQNIQGLLGSTFQDRSARNQFLDKTKTDRLAIANRWDFPLAQWGRSWLLVLQSHLRKHLVLPILIVLKNTSRFLLLQTTEWNEDWSEWSREIHIRCTYDGTEVSEKELPEQWLRDGLQIKIIYPFFLKPWHDRVVENEISRTSKHEKSAKKQKLRYCYLTAWGFLTDLPFGNMKKQPSFWKPVRKMFRKRGGLTSFNLFSLIRGEFSKISEDFAPKIVRSQPKSSKSHSNGLRLNTKYKNTRDPENKLSEIPEYLNIGNRSFNLQIQEESLHEKLTYAKNLETFVAKKTIEEEVYSHQPRRNQKLTKKLIRIKQMIIRFCRKNIEAMKERFLCLKINIGKMNINFKLWLQISKESIRNTSTRSSNNIDED